MPAIANAIDVLGQLLVDRHQHKGFFKLRCSIRRDAIKARRHRVPVAAKIGVHELGLVGQPAKRIAKDRRPLARLHNAEIDLLVVEACVLLLDASEPMPMKIARATRRVAE